MQTIEQIISSLEAQTGTPARVRVVWSRAGDPIRPGGSGISEPVTLERGEEMVRDLRNRYTAAWLEPVLWAKKEQLFMSANERLHVLRLALANIEDRSGYRFLDGWTIDDVAAAANQTREEAESAIREDVIFLLIQATGLADI